MDSWAKIAKLGDDDLIKTLAGDDASDRDHARRELAHRGEKERAGPPQTLQGRRAAGHGPRRPLGALESMWNADVQAGALFVLRKIPSADLPPPRRRRRWG